VDTKFFGIPFAAAGDRSTIPVAQQPDGSVSYTQGFGPDYEADLLTDPNAKPLPRDAENQFKYDVSSALGALQKEGAPQFITASDNEGVAFAYARGAAVRYGSPLRTFVSRIDNNTALPTDSASWAPLLFEAATNAQAIAGTAVDVIITPAALQAALNAASVTVPDASVTVKGIQRNATNAEAVAGTLANATVTPAGLTAAVAAMVPAASTTVAGRTRLATVAETAATSSAVLAVTPAGLAQTKEIAWVTGLQTTLDGLQNGINARLPNSGSSTYTGTLTLQGPTLGTGAFSSSTTAIHSVNTGNADTLRIVSLRGGNGGNSYTSARWRIVRQVDATDVAAFEFMEAETGTAFIMRGGSGAQLLEVKQNGETIAAGGFKNGSSRTIKDHHEWLDPEEALTRVLALRPAIYNYTNAPGTARRGYYAEDVAEVVPEAVTEGGPESFSPLLLEDAQMLPDHTAALQALYARIESLTALVAELKAAR
jgi:hypothetical protein